MGSQPVILMVVLVGLLFVPPTARGDDLADLKATFGQVVAAFNNRDADALADLAHEQLGFFAPTSPFPLEGKETLRKAFRTRFADRESHTVTSINPRFLVVGDVGVVYDHYSFTFKPKDGPTVTQFGRSMWTFAKQGGKWVLVAAHLSLIPTGN